MKKITSLFLLAGLLMATLFVFATSPKLINNGLHVETSPGVYEQISNDAAPSGLALQYTTSGNQMQITGPNGTKDVFFYDGSSYRPVTSDGSW